MVELPSLGNGIGSAPSAFSTSYESENLLNSGVSADACASLKYCSTDTSIAKSKTLELQQEIDECLKILEDYTSKQAEADLTFNNYAKRVILVAKNDAEAADWICKAREEHDRKTAEYGESIARIKTNLAALKRRKRSLTKLKEQSICLRSDQISQDKNLLKEYVHEYIECITLYKPSPLWVLVVVRFVDGSERWGTIKNVRYAKKEVKRDGEFKYTMGFSGWFINNDRHTLSYDKTEHTITEKRTEGKLFLYFYPTLQSPRFKHETQSGRRI